MPTLIRLRGMILVFGMVVVVSSHANAAEWSAGAALESRLQQEVNPDYNDFKNVGELFAKVNVGPWGGLLELGHEGRKSDSGSLHIHSQSTVVGVWGQREFWRRDRWASYLGLGLGNYFDRVDTSFEASSASRSGSRGYFGGATGLAVLLWGRVIVEGELRGVLVQDNTEPLFSALLRLGIQL